MSVYADFDVGLPEHREQVAGTGLLGVTRVQIQNIEYGLLDRAKGTPGNPRMNVLIALCRELRGRLIIDVAQPLDLMIEFYPLPNVEGPVTSR